MPLVCGVDSSTQSTKVELRDADSGDVVATGRAPHPATSPPRSEQRPRAWWGALVSALASTERAGEVAAVSVAGQQHGLVLLDGRGEEVRAAKLWNDTESAPQASRLVEALGPEAWAEATGSVPTAAFTVTKLAWVKEHEPDSFAVTRRVLLPHDWLTLGLTGKRVTDRGDASGTGYWSPRSGQWRIDLLQLVDGDVDWEAALPTVLGPSDTAGEVTPAAARDTGFPPGAVVAPGTGDNMAAALGIGLRPGDLAVSIGTSGTAYAVTGAPTADATGAVAGFADATGRFLPLVCTLNATKVTDTFMRLLGVARDRFDDLALSAQPGARGLTLVPYLDGERTPNRPDAAGLLAGLRTDAEPADVARAAVEGVVCGLLDGVDALSAAGVETGGRLFLVGGGARSPAYRRVLADLSGRPVLVPDSGIEHVAAGAAVQAAAVLAGTAPDEVAAAWRTSHRDLVEPDGSVDSVEIRERYAAVRG